MFNTVLYYGMFITCIIKYSKKIIHDAVTAGCTKTEKGTDYKGSIDVTATNKYCQPWAEILFYDKEESNFCRNPDNSKRPWCYVTKPPRRVWEYCAVPMCTWYVISLIDK